LKKYIFSVAATVVILTAVLWPGSQIPTTKWPVDKLVHFILFTGWTTAIIHDFNLKWVRALVAGVLFALFTEVIQIPIEKRSFDLNDVIADSAGILFAIANSGFFVRIAKRVLRR
jgi:VanZ family protein